MNRRIIEVKLTESEGADVLVFGLDKEKPEEYQVNLNSTGSQNELKRVFSKLLDMLLQDDISLELVVAEDYRRVLYKEVCKEYIKDLNREMDQVKISMKKELA